MLFGRERERMEAEWVKRRESTLGEKVGDKTSGGGVALGEQQHT